MGRRIGISADFHSETTENGQIISALRGYYQFRWEQNEWISGSVGRYHFASGIRFVYDRGDAVDAVRRQSMRSRFGRTEYVSPAIGHWAWTEINRVFIDNELVPNARSRWFCGDSRRWIHWNDRSLSIHSQIIDQFPSSIWCIDTENLITATVLMYFVECLLSEFFPTKCGWKYDGIVRVNQPLHYHFFPVYMCFVSLNKWKRSRRVGYDSCVCVDLDDILVHCSWCPVIVILFMLSEDQSFFYRLAALSVVRRSGGHCFLLLCFCNPEQSHRVW